MAHILEAIFLGDGRSILALVLIGCRDLVLGPISKLDHLPEEATVLVLHLIPVIPRTERGASKAVQVLKCSLLAGSLTSGCSGSLLLLFLLGLGGLSSGGKVGEDGARTGFAGRVGCRAGLDVGPGSLADACRAWST